MNLTKTLEEKQREIARIEMNNIQFDEIEDILFHGCDPIKNMTEKECDDCLDHYKECKVEMKKLCQ